MPADAASEAAPLILTVRFDADSFARFDAERRLHFPPERNLIPAHLTLFHHLPGGELAAISRHLAELAARQTTFSLRVSGLRLLGQGTAYVIDSEALLRLRADLARRWSRELTRQDAQGFRPHVTIQNKAPPNKAKALFERLTASFEPFEATATGLLLWHYRGGPWEAAGEYAFEDQMPALDRS